MRVLLHSPNRLFREGLRRLLAPYAEVMLVDTLDEMLVAARKGLGDTVIVDNAAWPGTISIWESLAPLLALPAMRVVLVNLDSQAVQIVQTRCTRYITADEFLRLVMA